MRRIAVAVICLAALTAQKPLSTPPGTVDAFLATHEARPLLDKDALSSVAREKLEGGRISSVEPRFGVPTFFWAARQGAGPSLRALGWTAEQAARQHLADHAEIYRAAEWGDSLRATVHDTGDGAVIATFRQRVGGIPLFRDEMKVVMARDLSLVALSGYLTPATTPRGGFELGAEAAVRAAYRHLTGRQLDPAKIAAEDDRSGYQRLRVAGQRRPARLRKVYFPLTTGLEPAFYVELEVVDSETRGYFSYVVSARKGEVLFRKNLTASDSFSYRVWADTGGVHVPDNGPMGHAPVPYPSAGPTAWAPPFVAPSLIALQNGPISTNDPWLVPGATTTEGNNVNAYADISAPDYYSAGDVLPDVTAPGVFDRTYDVTLPPDASGDQRKAAVTQLFYDVNFFHDWYYDKGFDEASGNAQAKNYGRGGLEGDPLEAQGQDFSGVDNADMSTPSDGESPRMQMYIFNGAARAEVLIDDAPRVSFKASTAQFGPARYSQAAVAQLVDDGAGTLTDGCESYSGLTGQIAVVDRGLCTFVNKALNAQAAGAVALIIVNNVGGPAFDVAGDDPSVTIPTVGLSLADGNALKKRLLAGPLQVTVSRAGIVDRDGTIDNTVIAHEWGHYISNRLIGDGNGISNNQAVGMGEGWGDFHSLLMAVREGDGVAADGAPWSGAFPVATYVAAAMMGDAGYYFGLRRMPYSTDFSKNGLTFKHIQEGVALPANVPTSFGEDGNGNSEVHATGEVWATMLWECYASLLRDTPRLTFAQAQDRMRGYLVAAYKATPVMPTFVDARDALLSVAAAKDPVDFRLFADAFARRGLGLRAVAPDRDSMDNSGLVESYTTGNDVMITAARLDDSRQTCDQDGQLDNDEKGKLTLTVKNVGTGELAAVVANVSTPFAGLTFPGGNVATFPKVPPFGSASASLNVALEGVSGTVGIEFSIGLSDPAMVPTPAPEIRSFRVNYDTLPAGSASDDVEAAKSLWTAGSDPNGNTSSDFRIFTNSATDHWWFGPNPASPADTWLISPPLEVGATASFGVSFKHRYAFEVDKTDPTIFYDAGVVEISDDGGKTWTDFGAKVTGGYPGRVVTPSTNPLAGQPAFVGKSPAYPQFKTVSADLGAAYAGKVVKIRFRIGSDDAAADKGWEIDDITFTGLATKPFASVVADPNKCANRPPVAVAGPDVTVDEGTQVTLVGSGTDPENGPVTLAWKQLDGPAVVLAEGVFTAPDVKQDAVLTFELRAFDGKQYSEPVTQKVTVRNVNHAPSVVAPALVQAKAGAAVRIQGAGFDPDGDPLVYTWKQVGGATLSLTGADKAELHFTAPAGTTDAELGFELTVSDGALSSRPFAIKVLVVGTSTQPPAAPKSGCGCSGAPGSAAGSALLWLLALALVRRRSGRFVR